MGFCQVFREKWPHLPVHFPRLASVKGQKGRREGRPAPLQHGGQRLPVHPLLLQPHRQLGNGPPAAAADSPAQGLRRLGRLPVLLRPGAELHLHAAGAQCLEHLAGVFRAEQERRVGRPLLHDFQQHVLVLLRQQGAVRKEVHLPPPLVGTDVGVSPDRAHHVHGDVLVVRVPDGDDVGVDVLPHLPAGGTHSAGLSPVRRALHGRRRVAGQARPVTAAGEQQGVGQRSPACRLPDAERPGVLFQCIKQGHGGPPSSSLL